MKTSLLLLLLLLTPIAASAQDTPFHAAPYVVLVAGQVADLWTTQAAIGRGAVETNPGLAGTSRATLALTKVGGTVVLVGLMRLMETHGHPTAAHVFGYLSGGASVALAISNARVQR